MLFHTIDFAIFFPIVFFLYWFVARRDVRSQNIILLFASYFFYGWWDYRFLFLLIFSTFLDYFTGLKIFDSRDHRQKKMWLILSVGTNLGFLGFFKYYNFFIGSFAAMLEYMGFQANLWTLNIILPVGISFYTFHGLSYVFDIYYGKFVPTRNFIDYSVFVSFFPLLVAGPIERATHLLPQVQAPRKFEYHKAADGLRQILWGLFKKIVVADNCANYANQIFNNSDSYDGSTLLLGAIFFAFQIYGDFSGYSDIALGTARILGFELLRNFAFPYFSRDIAEFWRRWHISLSSWFRDYLYIPLGGSKASTVKKIRNTFIIFLVSGFWHGANWTFLAWGALNAIYFLPLLVLKKNRDNIEIAAKGRVLPSAREFISILSTFGLTLIAWIFFRAENMTHAITYLERMFTGLFDPLSFSESLHFIRSNTGVAIPLLLAAFIMVEWLGRESKYAIENLSVRWHKPLRWALYYSITILIFLYRGQEQQFIYFQF